MDGRIMKYNPAFLSREELVEKFVVRHAELDLIVRAIRENTRQSNQHLLVIGPRGSGKTMLVLRAAEEVRRQRDLAEQWYPLVFAEESYQVTTPGEFWLEAIFHLAQRTEDPKWKAAHKELHRESDEDRLRERALAQLLDFADAQGKRLLLVVENLNMLLGKQMTDDDGWVLRHTLLHEPRIMLLTTATSRFEEIDSDGKSMFELFRTITLEPLDEGDCCRMWTSITSTEPGDNRIRPIQILTGGNPRLVAIISSFGARLSLQRLMTDVMQLVDEHTEYFKSHLDNLAPTERKVYLALAELWDPASTREVARTARLGVNQTSSLLGRLKERGVVLEMNASGRRKLYQVSERLCNTYYLMRRHRVPSRRVRAIINFMVAFYGERVSTDTTRAITGESCKSGEMKLQSEAADAMFNRGCALVEPEESPGADRDRAWPPRAGRERTELERTVDKLEEVIKRDLADLEQRRHRCESAMEVLKESVKHLGSAEAADETMVHIINLVIGLAADENAEQSLELLRNLPSAELLEPLVVGLRIFLGEEVRAAAEIMEVAKDVVARIEKKRKELESSPAVQEQKEDGPNSLDSGDTRNAGDK